MKQFYQLFELDKHLIQIYDFSTSLTTITCHETGYNFHWGSSTPVELKTIVERIMSGDEEDED